MENTEDCAWAARIPAWIDADLVSDAEDIRAICYGGCASGAYMPAVTYHEASKVMHEFGNEVVDFIHEHGEFPELMDDHKNTWSKLCVRVLSYAVEIWAGLIAAEFELGAIFD